MSINPLLESMTPYRPGRSIESVKRQYQLSQVIKLASNENPLGPSPKALAAIAKYAAESHLYPDGSSSELTEKLASHHQVPYDHICLGNGSDELFDQLIRIYVDPGEAVLVSQGAFNAYALSALAHRASVIEVPLRSDFQIDLEAFDHVLRTRLKENKIRLVFIPNINNPTGLLLPYQEIVNFLEKWGRNPEVLIVIDEAYHHFISSSQYRSACQFQKEFPSLIVSRTFSKSYGLAGLRLGYLIAPSQVCTYIHRVRKPFNVNRLAQKAGLAALDDHDFLERSQQLIRQEKVKIRDFLAEHQISFLPSEGNFYMINMKRDLKLVEEFFLKHGVIIRPVDNYGFTTWIRVSVGLPEENTKMLLVLEECFRKIEELPDHRY
ncbi:MAG: histidinol-phosphate transaminase [Bdellovibrionaceae bacterium]|nr:histidinol-phosphate transaminase [Pseudobdellovibrionaceae bacterium]MDW8190091.1 histidinol-phosphate transaminase [Pseudobdellovibrionaceae bacterium]